MLKLPETMSVPLDREHAGLGQPLRLLPPPKIVEVTAADCWEAVYVPKEDERYYRRGRTLPAKTGLDVGRGSDAAMMAYDTKSGTFQAVCQQAARTIMGGIHGCGTGLGAIGQHE